MRGSAVCVGFADLDVIHRVDAPPVWGSKGTCRSVELATGGPASNAAVTAAALLGSATLITAVGQGAAADLVRADLAEHDVTLVDCAPPGWVLPVATAIVTPDGERTVVSPSGQTSSFALTPLAKAVVADAAGLLLDGHHPVAAREAIDARPAGCPAVLDAGSVKAHAQAWLADLDVVAGSAAYAKGLGVDLAAAVGLVLDAGTPAAVMTDGANPVCWATGQDRNLRWATPPTVEALDTLGAGDAFHGALLAALVSGADLATAIQAACQVAAARVASAGARAWLADLALIWAAHGAATGLPQLESERRAR